MSEWIRVNDKLPKRNGAYLCASKCGNHLVIDVVNFATNLEKIDKSDFENERHSGWYKYDSEWGYYEIIDITHWMPLPAMPKGE